MSGAMLAALPGRASDGISDLTQPRGSLVAAGTLNQANDLCRCHAQCAAGIYYCQELAAVGYAIFETLP